MSSSSYIMVEKNKHLLLDTQQKPFLKRICVQMFHKNVFIGFQSLRLCNLHLLPILEVFCLAPRLILALCKLSVYSLIK